MKNAHFLQVVTSTWRWHHETLSFPNQTCSMCLSIIYYINMFQVSVDFLSGLSSVQAFYSPQCTCHVYNWFRTTDAPIVRTSGNPEFRQNSAEFGSAENLQNSTEWVFSWQCSITYISFPSHAHGVYTIAPHLNMWNTLLCTSKVSVNNEQLIKNYQIKSLFLWSVQV
jgi:hypothetical protein